MSRRVANLEAKDQTAVWATEYGVEVSHYRFAAIKPPFIGRAPTTLAHVLQIAAGSDETCNLRGLHVGLHRYWSKLYGRDDSKVPQHGCLCHGLSDFSQTHEIYGLALWDDNPGICPWPVITSALT